MTFEEWLKWTRGAVGSDSPECMAKWAWKYQQMRIDDLEQWIACIADDHPQIPDWIQQSARSLLAQEEES